MAAAFGLMGGVSGSASLRLRNPGKKMGGNRKNGSRVFCVSSPPSSMADPYTTLRLRPGASESEVKKAFRQLALKYHPDVCRGSNCGVQFHQIYEAYDNIMSYLKGETATPAAEEYYEDDGEEWEEWMGYEAAGVRDWSHVNPYF
ncbi:PREDICTED: chaperone protein dnaJ 8, chloroplastic-like [Ipomoea nil]|uniref:chaperone protein dnaJ 8, chloroplastic-like n=1 Tax=Ipomoea nil TaxID=35883 RepID=UPI00090159FA|nr:PREDICTED: chaperone protein dnaJ 8, chloroplastic-like [Ipomoea nil]